MRGRKPTPTKLRLLRGNPGRRPLPEDEPEPDAGLPAAPDHLNAVAAKEWARTGARLLKSGLVTELDENALAVYCTAYARWLEAEDQVSKFGPVILSPGSGFPVQSPYLQIANKAMEQMLRVGVEFGLTPSSRTRVKSAKRSAKPNPLQEFLGASS